MKHLKVVLRLLVDILYAVLCFVVIGGAALGVSKFIKILESNGVPAAIIKVFEVLEYGLFTIDVLGFVFLVVMSFYRMVLAIWELRLPEKKEEEI